MTELGSNNMLAALQQLFPYEGWLAKLDAMALHGGARTRGMLAGKRSSSSLGSSLEFADYRPYIAGDDIRRIDWNLYGRTNKAYIRQYWDEQERSFHLYVDSSRSMTAIGEGEHNKWLTALRMAASVGYVALQGDDRVSISLFNEKEVHRQLPMLHGKHAKFTMISRLSESITEASIPSEAIDEAFVEDAGSAISDAAAPFAGGSKLPRRAGVTWIFSDGLYEQGLDSLLSSLQARQQQVVFVHILHGDELAPQLEGEWRFIDIETSRAKEVAMSPAVIEKYKRGVSEFRERLRKLCESRGIGFFSIVCSEALPDSFMKLLSSGSYIQYR
ncbi:DUF58 domain-containing protein [Paenibacillus camelliae]|uniref:DUF58 domain-containing protein n=1 Tax=Paenibacillus camelliae TaxID=512410 RepID=UPI0020416061|nr:DUF58 domain-containing protein [Paenibacillus camelliae]MCM3631945.1 DUF58 domain-containing protein [Paenibacillus camelliae]